MRALIISYRMLPAPSARAFQVGRLLKHIDLSAKIVCGDRGPGPEPAWMARYEIARTPRAEWEKLRDRIDHRLRPDRLRRPDPMAAWARRRTRELLAIGRRDFDLLISFGQPMSDHLAALELKRAWGLPWLAHFSDPWVDNPYHRTRRATTEKNQAWECEVLAHCDMAVFTNDEALGRVMGKYPEGWREKARVLPHAWDPEDYPGVGRRRGPLPILRHVGELYGERKPDPAIRALTGIEQRCRVEFIGRSPAGCRAEALDWPRHHDIRFIRPVSYAESLARMQEADLLLLIDAPAELSVFLPSKLMDYIGSGTPIVGITPAGATRSCLEKLGYRSADPEDDRSIARAIEASLHRKSPVNEEARSGFRADRVARQFTELIAELDSSRAVRRS